MLCQRISAFIILIDAIKLCTIGALLPEVLENTDFSTTLPTECVINLLGFCQPDGANGVYMWLSLAFLFFS